MESLFLTRKNRKIRKNAEQAIFFLPFAVRVFIWTLGLFHLAKCRYEQPTAVFSILTFCSYVDSRYLLCSVNP